MTVWTDDEFLESWHLNEFFCGEVYQIRNVAQLNYMFAPYIFVFQRGLYQVMFRVCHTWRQCCGGTTVAKLNSLYEKVTEKINPIYLRLCAQCNYESVIGGGVCRGGCTCKFKKMRKD